MPTIMPIRDLRNTDAILKLSESFACINKIDQAIFEAEKEMIEGAKLISVESAMQKLNDKYY